MDDEKNKLIDTLAAAISDNPQAKALFDAAFSGNEENTGSNSSEKSSLPDISMLLKMQDVLSGLGTSDERSKLLEAIKPFLSDDRKEHVDTAIKLMKLIGIVKVAGSLNLFDNFKL